MERKFKKGDKVRFIRDNRDGGAAYGAKGDSATVCKVGMLEGKVRVVLNKCREGCRPVAFTEDLEFVSDKPARPSSEEEFKVGDRVVYNGASCLSAEKGATATVGPKTAMSADSLFLNVVWDRNGLDCGQFDGGYSPENFAKMPSTSDQTNLRLIEPSADFDIGTIIAHMLSLTPPRKTKPKTAIVAVLKNGAPRPSETPHVHHNRTTAEREAERLADKYKGDTFAVFERVSEHKCKKRYEHEWQNLVAEGELMSAIKELRRLTDMPLRTAKYVAEDWRNSIAARAA